MPEALIKLEPTTTVELQNHVEPGQPSLFPAVQLYALPKQQTNRKPIKLPRSILTIAPDELLNEYLSRVANAAMKATTLIYGSASRAASRLGTSDEDPEPPRSKPKLALATTKNV